MTLGAWFEHWVSTGTPGKRKRKNTERTVERYAQLLRTRVTPAIGTKALQQLQPGDVDKLYTSLEGKISDRTVTRAHRVLIASLSAAVRTKMLAVNPIDRAEKIPSAGEGGHGLALDDDQLRTLVKGFRNSPALLPRVCVLAFTGCRRNEPPALRWTDLDVAEKTLRIERAIEETKAGLRFKGPKKGAHKRTITIDDDMIEVLVTQRVKHQRIIAGLPDAAEVGLSLVKLPKGALIFPGLPAKASRSRW